VLGIDGGGLKKTCRKLLQKHIADIVASDAHGTSERANHMLDCYNYLCKKYDEGYAAKLLYGNARRIIEEIDE
jgi:protein-tyrosine phosphatase